MVGFFTSLVSGLGPESFEGLLADRSNSRFGRRRPFMIGGTVLCVIAMILLGFTQHFAAIFTTFGSSAVRDLISAHWCMAHRSLERDADDLAGSISNIPYRLFGEYRCVTSRYVIDSCTPNVQLKSWRLIGHCWWILYPPRTRRVPMLGAR